jgi:hypothetical protein
MNNQTPNQYGLFFPLAPNPYPEESISSWVIRLCGAYQCSFARLKDMAGLHLPNDDWDLELDQALLKQFLRAAGLEIADFQYRWINPQTHAEIGLELIARYFSKKPAYAWCPTCFDEDAEPYLRWQWRFKNYMHCIKHRTLLSTSCFACGFVFTTHRSLLSLATSKTPTINLAFCQGCGSSLGYRSSRDHRITFGQRLSFKHTWPDLQRGEDVDLSVRIHRLGKTDKPNAFVVYPTHSQPSERMIGSKWSRSLTPQSRYMLARALISIRRELRQNRAEHPSRISP